MFSRRNIAGFNLEKHLKHGWNIDLTSKIHQCLRCLMSDWCIIDVIDDSNNQSSNVFSTGITIAGNVLVHNHFFLIDGYRSPYKWCWKIADFFRLLSFNIDSESRQYWTSSTLLASQTIKKWIKLLDNVAFHWQHWGWWNQMSLFCMKFGFSTFFTDFSGWRFRCTIAFILKQRTLQRLSFFFWGNLVFRLGMLFFCASIKKY